MKWEFCQNPDVQKVKGLSSVYIGIILRGPWAWDSQRPNVKSRCKKSTWTANCHFRTWGTVHVQWPDTDSLVTKNGVASREKNKWDKQKHRQNVRCRYSFIELFAHTLVLEKDVAWLVLTVNPDFYSSTRHPNITINLITPFPWQHHVKIPTYPYNRKEKIHLLLVSSKILRLTAVFKIFGEIDCGGFDRFFNNAWQNELFL